MVLKRKKLKSQIFFNKRVAKKFHDTNYYESTASDIRNYRVRELDKILLHTEPQQDISYLLSEYKKLKAIPIYNVLFNIFKKNKSCAGSELPPPIHDNLLSIVAHPSILLIAYKTVRSNKGALTPGALPSSSTLDNLEPQELRRILDWHLLPDGFSRNVLEELSNLLKKGKYKWGINQRIYVDKPGKPPGEKRPLTLPPFMDKVVQESIRMVLECIYEPWFEISNCSFGFRSNKGCHDAITHITTRTKNSNTDALHIAIEGDIKGAYDKVDRSILLKILGKRIKDKKFLNLLKDRLKLQLFDVKEKKYEDTSEGIPQGGSDSPYLFNIYMAEFDKFILKDIKSYIKLINKKRLLKRPATNKVRLINSKKRRQMIKSWQKENPRSYISENPRNPAYIVLQHKLTVLKKQLEHLRNLNINNEPSQYEILRKMRLLSHQKRNVRSIDPNRSKIRIHYTRYADDWILLMNGNPQLAKILKNKIEKWLYLNLKATMAPDKTLITDLRKDPAKFLGFELRLSNERLTKKVNQKYLNKRTGEIVSILVRKRIAGWKIYVSPDRQRLLNRLHMKGYCTKKGFPREIPWLSNIEGFSIIEKYNSVLRGLCNYYAEFINNKGFLGQWTYIIRWSCIKTLAQKYSTTCRGIFERFGYNGSISIPVILKDRENQSYIKYYTLLTQLEANNLAVALNRRNSLVDNHLSLQNKIFPSYSKDFQRSPRITDDGYLDRINWVNRRTQANLDLPCCLCGSYDNVEMHHIRHVRKSKYIEIPYTQSWRKLMGLRNRKQIPLCRIHHNMIHAGEYDGPSIKKVIRNDPYDSLSYHIPLLYDNRIIHPESFVHKGKIHTTKSLEEKGWKKCSVESSDFSDKAGSHENFSEQNEKEDVSPLDHLTDTKNINF